MSELSDTYQLDKHEQNFVRRMVETGRFPDAKAVIQAGLETSMKQIDDLENLRDAIAQGDADIEAGRTYEYSNAEEMIADILDLEQD